MTTSKDQKEITRLIKQYSKLKDIDLRKLLSELEGASGTYGDKISNRLKIRAIKTLLM